MAPPANRVPVLMGGLLSWLVSTEQHPLIVSSVFHYEFEFIHPFSDGNGRLGRLWQSLILAQWNPLLAQLPVESMVHAEQSAYYQALNASTQQSDSAPFIEFMLGAIMAALEVYDEGATPQVTPQVKKLLLLLADNDEPLSREALLAQLGLKDRKSFSARYLAPALAHDWVEMTLPDKPNSRLQRYRLTEAGRTLR